MATKSGPVFETAFNHHIFTKLEPGELYLVYRRENHMEVALVAPSLAWLDVPFTYAEPGEIMRVQKVRVVETYDPK